MTENKSILKRVSKIFELGYIPSRGDESYLFRTKNFMYAYKLCNCFEHACFNLTNSILDDLDVCNDEEIHLQGFNAPNLFSKQKAEVEESFLGVVKQVGLIMEPCSMEQALKFNQWKVALYFEEIEFNGKKWLNDFHFLKEEQDGSWSGKIGYTKVVKEYAFPPEICDNYCHYNTYLITNPHAKERG